MTTPSEAEKTDFPSLFGDIQRHVEAGREYHQSPARGRKNGRGAGRRRRTDTDARFLELFDSLDSLLAGVQRNAERLSSGAASFDFIRADGSHVCGNGFRSLLFLLCCVLSPLLAALQRRSKESGGRFFHPADHLHTLHDHCRALQGIDQFLRNAVVMMEENETGCLFAGTETNEKLIRVSCVTDLCRDIFYGKLLGFQYDSTLKPVLKSIAIGMASYEKWYLSDRGEPVKLFHSLRDGGKYLRNPALLGQKLDYLTQETSIHFVKAFWSLLEQDTVTGAMKVISPRVDVCQWLEVPAQEVLVESTSGAPVTVKPPSALTGYKPIPLLLISNKHRGMQGGSASCAATTPPSRGLVVHMHGGGFVAQSPKSHEFYLRKWSRELDCPVVSIAYSLAPEAPYPQALDECVLAYAWILNNFESLGSTGERIVLAGDSAGGQLAITLAMKLKQLGIRLPHRVLSVYPALNLSTTVSPSKVTALLDPLLPLGVLISILQAVTGHVPTEDELKTRREYRSKILTSLGRNTVDPFNPEAKQQQQDEESETLSKPNRETDIEGNNDTSTSSRKIWSFRNRTRSEVTASGGGASVIGGAEASAGLNAHKRWSVMRKQKAETEVNQSRGNSPRRGWSFRRNKQKFTEINSQEGEDIETSTSRIRRRWSISRFSFRSRSHTTEVGRSEGDHHRPNRRWSFLRKKPTTEPGMIDEAIDRPRARRSWSFRRKTPAKSELIEEDDDKHRRRSWSIRRKKRAAPGAIGDNEEQEQEEEERPQRSWSFRWKKRRSASGGEYSRVKTSVSGELLLVDETRASTDPLTPPNTADGDTPNEAAPLSDYGLQERVAAVTSSDIEARRLSDHAQESSESSLTFEPLFETNGLLGTILEEGGGAVKTLLAYQTKPLTDDTSPEQEGDVVSTTNKLLTDEKTPTENSFPQVQVATAPSEPLVSLDARVEYHDVQGDDDSISIGQPISEARAATSDAVKEAAIANGVVNKLDGATKELQTLSLAETEKDTLPPDLEPLLQEVLRGYDNHEVNRDPFLSPVMATAELLAGLPPINIVAASLDPLLDDSVEMAKLLQSVGQPVTLDVIEQVPHGFLCLMSAGKNAQLERGQSVCVEHCREGLK